MIGPARLSNAWGRLDNLHGPWRAWAFPFGLQEHSELYTGVNLIPTASSEADLQWMDAHHVTALHWAFGPISKFTSGMSEEQAVKYFTQQLTSYELTPSGWHGAGIDEWAPPSTEFARSWRAAAAGYRRARMLRPTQLVGAWASYPRPYIENASLRNTFNDLVADSTVDLAFIEGYTVYDSTYPAFRRPPVSEYFPLLDDARSRGFLNRTVFCFGWMLGRSVWNPHGWTNQSLRAAVTHVASKYAELAGVAMYAPPTKYVRANDTSTLAVMAYASLLMLEFFPDRSSLASSEAAAATDTAGVAGAAGAAGAAGVAGTAAAVAAAAAATATTATATAAATAAAKAPTASAAADVLMPAPAMVAAPVPSRRPAPPYRIWAFPYQIVERVNALYNGTTLVPTWSSKYGGYPTAAAIEASHGIVSLDWRRSPHELPASMNRTAAVDFYTASFDPKTDADASASAVASSATAAVKTTSPHPGWAGVGVDEWNFGGNPHANETFSRSRRRAIAKRAPAGLRTLSRTGSPGPIVSSRLSCLMARSTSPLSRGIRTVRSAQAAVSSQLRRTCRVSNGHGLMAS